MTFDGRTDEPSKKTMIPVKTPVQWRILGKSVQGASHKRGDLPNQDALAWEPKIGDGPPAILALADGHGSPKSFRSKLGAQFAVEVATDRLREFLETWKKAQHSKVKHAAEDDLPRILVRSWADKVDGHRQEKPFTSEELDGLASKEGVNARQLVEQTPRLAYGSTIIVVAVAGSFILYLQLGDGDILAVTDDGEVESPVPPEPDAFGDETVSLCSKRSEFECRVVFQRLDSNPPALILLATDGFKKSFTDEAGFRKAARDILERIRSHGPDAVNDEMGGWLDQWSRQGSGDDITLGILHRHEAS